MLVREAGFTPLGLVLGSSVFHIGMQYGNWKQNMELGMLSQAMYQARWLAMERMQAEAHALGAHGIVGVRVVIRPQAWGEAISEFLAIGTAIVADETDVDWHGPNGRPFTSDLSGADFWKLLRTGYAPLGLVMGTCVYHVAHRGLLQSMQQAGRNVEIPQFTQAIYDAREIALSRMQAEAGAVGAQGIVGATVVEHPHVWGHHATEFFAMGTAVRSIKDDHVVPAPQLVLGVNG